MSIDAKQSFTDIMSNIDEIWKYPSSKELNYVISFSKIDPKPILDDFKSLCEPKSLKECCKHMSYYDDIYDNISDDEKFKIYGKKYHLIKALSLFITDLWVKYEKLDGKKIDRNFMPDFNFDS